jgi:hypothetical protein
MRRLRCPAVCCAAWLLAAASFATDRLILRNLDILTGYTITSFDEDGLVLDRPRPGSGPQITWDEIERGKVALDQPRFDALLAEFGPPLYRVRQRLKIGDYEAAAGPAELLYPRFAERKSQTAYLVCQATMWSRLAAGRREAGVEPYLRTLEMLRSKVASAAALPGNRRPAADLTTGISPELLPVWFDATAANDALAEVQQAIRVMPQPRPTGVYVYYATLAIAAGQATEVARILPSLDGEDGVMANWRDIVQAEQELASDSPGAAIERLRAGCETLPEPCRPVGLYLVGLAGSQSADQEVASDGILAMLTLPAVYGAEHPELSAAGLYQAAAALDKLNDKAGAAAVRRELASHYVGTRFGAKVRSH